MTKLKKNTWYQVSDPESQHNGLLMKFEQTKGVFNVFEDSNSKERQFFTSSTPELIPADPEEVRKAYILHFIRLVEGYDWPEEVKTASIAYEKSKLDKRDGDADLKKIMTDSWKKYQRNDLGAFLKDKAGNYLQEETDGFKPMVPPTSIGKLTLSGEGLNPEVVKAFKDASTRFSDHEIIGLKDNPVFEELTPISEEAFQQLNERSEEATFIDFNPEAQQEPEFTIGDLVIISNLHHQYAGRSGKVKKFCTNVFPDRIYVELDPTPGEKVSKVAMVETRMIKLTGIQTFQNLTPHTMTKDTSTAVSEQSGSGYTMMKIKLTLIAESALNPRKHFDDHAVNELAASIKEKGVLQPILVRPIMDSLPQTYEIVCGARRYRASKLAEMKYIPAVVRDISDDEALEMMIVENLQRKDVNPMEEAAAIQNMVKHYKSYTEVALRLGKSARFVAERDKLNNLIEGFQKALYQGSLLVKTANELAKVSKESQQMIYDEAIYNNGSETITWKGYISDDTLLNMVRNKAKASLASPPFDPEDTTLTKAPACSVCSFNSANQPLLFEEGEPTCLNSVCFGVKKQVSFQNKLKDAAESGILMINTSYGDADKETRREVADLGASILKRDDFEEFRSKTAEPDGLMDFEEFKNYWLDEHPDDEGSEDGWFRIKYKGYVQRHNEAVEAYQKERRLEEEAAAAKGYVKAFVVDGYNSEKGTYKLIKPKSSAKAAAATGGGAADAEILEQIRKIEEREARAKELDREKIYGQATPLLGKEWTDDTSGLSQLEQIAVIIALCHQFYHLRDKVLDMLGINDRDWNMINLYNALMTEAEKGIEKTESVLNLCLRFTIPNCLIDASTLDYQKNARPAVIMDLVRARKEQELAEIELNQKGMALARQERVDKKLADLRSQLKSAKKGGKDE